MTLTEFAYYLRRVLPLAVLGVIIILIPVSYTHLDVYKRQILGVCATAARIRRLLFLCAVGTCLVPSLRLFADAPFALSRAAGLGEAVLAPTPAA